MPVISAVLITLFTLPFVTIGPFANAVSPRPAFRPQDSLPNRVETRAAQTNGAHRQRGRLSNLDWANRPLLSALRAVPPLPGERRVDDRCRRCTAPWVLNPGRKRRSPRKGLNLRA